MIMNDIYTANPNQPLINYILLGLAVAQYKAFPQWPTPAT